MWSLEFFEQHVLQSAETSRPTSCGFGPVAAINDEFLRFAAIKRSHDLLCKCFKFIILLSGIDPATMDISHEEFATTRIQMPQDIDALVSIARSFPAGIHYFADRLVHIIGNPCFAAFSRIAAIPVNSYYSISTKEIATFIRDEEAMQEIMQHVNDLYDECAMIYRYHKQNGWTYFHYNMLDAEDEDVFEKK